MTSLVDFLRARLDEDELAARLATISEPGRKCWSVVGAEGPDNGVVRDGEGERVADDVLPQQARHIARHDPARVLREVEAKRRVLDAYEAQIDRRQVLGVIHDAELAKGDENASELAEVMGQGIAANIWAKHLYWVIQTMAMAYDSHPDYREEWKP